MKYEKKLEAIALRKEGLSYKEINQEIHVSRSTLSHWLKDIPLSIKQKKRLYDRKLLGAYRGAKNRQLRRIKTTKITFDKAKKEFLRLYKNPLFLAGLLLYWAEGDKHKGEMVKFTNSDSSMIALMMKWFREICRVSEDKFRIGLHMHNLYIKSDLKTFWSAVTGVPTTQFHKIYIKKTSLRFRRNILYNGTCSIRIYDVSLFRKIIGWKEALLKYFNVAPRSSMDRTRDF